MVVQFRDDERAFDFKVMALGQLTEPTADRQDVSIEIAAIRDRAELATGIL
jgi:hypothetical protein